PYANEELLKLLSETGSLWRSDAIGITGSGAPLQRLTNWMGEVDGVTDGIYCMARQHASESPGSWVLDGFLRHITSVGADAPMVWTIPFVDVDGVLAGRPGKDAYPWDFNRAWGSKLFPKEAIPEYGSHP